MALIDAISGELPAEQPETGKNPAAVALGRLGGLKRGKARAKNPSKGADPRLPEKPRSSDGAPLDVASYIG